MSDSISHYFRSITHTFLDKEWEEGFSVYYKVLDGGKEKYLQFAQYTPEDYTRLEKIMKEADRQEFFIHENDLVRYYTQCVIPRLQSGIQKDNAAPLDIVYRSYPVMRRILSDYFDFDTSSRMLRVLENFQPILCPLFEETVIAFPSLFQITGTDSSYETHCANVGLYCLYLGSVLKMKQKHLKELFIGGLLLDIGKKEFSEELKGSKTDLNKEDQQAIRRHPSAARKILNDMKCYSENVRKMAYEHHENFDGSGYPLGLEGEKIALYSRIARIMDRFAAMTSDRPYRQAIKPVEALQRIKGECAPHFDPRLIDVLFKSFTRS